MADLISGVTGGARIILAWVFPAAIALAAAQVLFLRPLGLDRATGLDRLPAAEWAVALAAGATSIGLTLSAVSTPLYRVLEGYSWPKRLQESGKRRELARRRRLVKLSEEPLDGVQHDLAVEALMRFPRDETQMAPTRLGNALRAFETYGVDTFRLDSQAFWTELVAVVPESLRVEIANARSGVDFLVAATYLSGAVGALAILAGMMVPGGPDGILLLLGLALLVSTILWYRAAVAATTYWDSTVRALVDLGRKPLADALGFSLPRKLDKEREMWTLLASLSVYGYGSEWSDQLDAFRASPASAPSTAKASSGSGARSAARSTKGHANGSG